MHLRPPSVVGLLTVLPFLLLAARARSEEPGALVGIVMEVIDLTSTGGSVYCDLYNQKEGFPTEPRRALARAVVRPEGRRATCVFPNVKAGSYAVAVWHDVDGDRHFDTNWLGIPSEPVGTSNNARGRLGPPRFKDAAFDFVPPRLQQTIRLE
jgi:uncharacterized protein (DUF2141 family)